MPTNWVEDQAIANIDRQRAGIDRFVLDEELNAERQALGFFMWAVDKFYEEAARFPGLSCRELEAKCCSLRARLGQAKAKLTQFTESADGSRRQTRKLHDYDDESDKKDILRNLEQEVNERQRVYEDAQDCLHARRFLKEQPYFVKIGLRIERQADLEFAMARLEIMYPDI